MGIVDTYAQKLVNGGFPVQQAAKIILAGIKGYRSKVERCKKEGRRLRRTSRESLGARIRNKLIGKSNWFRKGRKSAQQEESKKARNGKVGRKKDQPTTPWTAPRSVLFVEQTNGGELATKLRELLVRIEPVLGFKIKVVERCGTTIKDSFPQAALWEGTKCGRESCITCEQGGEIPLPPCTKPSLVYENTCRKCNPLAAGKEELKEVYGEQPSLYVGETSRSIMERSREHWSGWRRDKDDNHIVRHQRLVHPGEEPDFTMRVVKFSRSALERQLGEAVRIRRRGGEGAILNSKAEYNRCHVTRLRLERKEEWEERLEENKRWEEGKTRELDADQVEWERMKTRERGKIKERTAGQKREPPSGEVTKGSRKKFKYKLMGADWGEPSSLEGGEEESIGATQLSPSPQPNILGGTQPKIDQLFPKMVGPPPPLLNEHHTPGTPNNNRGSGGGKEQLLL